MDIERDANAGRGLVPTDAGGRLDEALGRLHRTGPELCNSLSNHAPMVVESLAARGRPEAVHAWLDRYRGRLAELPVGLWPVTEENWREALGREDRVGDWTAFFLRETRSRPWPELLAHWWPRLLPGLYGHATHPVIRVGHAVRALRQVSTPEGVAPVGARLDEFAHALGYWASHYVPVSGVGTAPGAPDAAGALAAVPGIVPKTGGFLRRLGRVERLPVWAAEPIEAQRAEQSLRELVAAATHRYAEFGHGDPVMLVHAATAPNAVLRVLPSLPTAWWPESLRAAWTASAAVTAMYGTTEPRPHPVPERADSEVTPGTVAELVDRALRHGDEHVLKFVDTALDVGDGRAVTAALRAIEWGEPL
ncbi:questin oxidase family protein (plasmid) [Streptomyces sp. BI20]|uniref:questin oxidase family protein n=1 Tax=Streptomyces sp. BI20 TaxID=3403460 RepID=UPI003C777112